METEKLAAELFGEINGSSSHEAWEALDPVSRARWVKVAQRVAQRVAPTNPGIMGGTPVAPLTTRDE